MIKFDLVSDLHTDLWSSNVSGLPFGSIKNVDSSGLIIAGDTSNYLNEVIEILKNAVMHYEYVMFVDGNHEHYMTSDTVPETMKYLKEQSKQLGIFYLDGLNQVTIKDTLFIGANGWYDFKLVEPEYSSYSSYETWLQVSNDPKMVNWGVITDKNDERLKLNPSLLAKLQSDQLSKIVSSVQKDDAIENIVLITHTAPRKEFVSLTHVDPAWDKLSGAYGNSQMMNVLNADIKNKIKVWCFGHTHVRMDKTVDGVRYINNCRGYQYQQHLLGSKWSPVQIIL